MFKKIDLEGQIKVLFGLIACGFLLICLTVLLVVNHPMPKGNWASCFIDIKFLLKNSDEDNVFYGSYEGIIAQINVSKPTIVKTFHQLIDVGLLVKVKNKIYKIHPDVATQEQ